MKLKGFIGNLTLTTQDTEYSFVFPSGTVAFAVKARTSVAIKYSWVLGQSGTVYKTIPAGGELKWEDLRLEVSKTLYLQSGTSGTVVEIEYFM